MIAALSSGAWAQATPASPAANPANSPAAGPAAPPALKRDDLPRDIIVTPQVLPTPEEEQAYHDAEYARLKAMFGPPELPPISRGDALSRDETQNTGTVAGPKAVNCPDVVACYAPPK
ncbi:hypothetical protein UAJ10_25795 [Nitrospirillum sp. BR 11164]|uniref:hypothetical protein n=1 Tax=Nitrospirillum sp. BR 11164 TaxID=3104324 RepID=UPI002AFF3F73|nr:hypothetical protein [Nitrospirillum sp. BR 11164]MEA1652410.1 hypothetical protein [Nitrospirillum sp. BR 11164]